MSRIIIFYNRFMNEDHSFSVGGIQTYIHLLIRALKDHYKIVVVQCNDEKFKFESLDFDLISIGHTNIGETVKYIESDLLKNTHDLLLFASEQHACKSKWKNTIVIQHGVYWDLPVESYNPKITNNLLSQVYKIYDNYRNYKRISYFNDVICVDNNYINWYRTLTNGCSNKNFYPILNCAADDFFIQKPNKNTDKIKILFARRFVKIRGVELFSEVVMKLIEKYDQVEFLIVGDGPEEKWFKNKLSHFDQVEFKTASYIEMPNIMSKSDIVVVPSLGSEGTSLSAIEAMAAGKAIVTTNVGGLTNIIIHNFNGLLSDTTVNSIFDNIANLIEDCEQRNKISSNARLVAEEAFTFKEWSSIWNKTIETIIRKNEGLR
ncbi:MAG TPA: glycosyltransferase [Arcobacter sp.]|nr:glycosyltransferase [Arcobacter sp.]